MASSSEGTSVDPPLPILKNNLQEDSHCNQVEIHVDSSDDVTGLNFTANHVNATGQKISNNEGKISLGKINIDDSEENEAFKDAPKKQKQLKDEPKLVLDFHTEKNGPQKYRSKETLPFNKMRQQTTGGENSTAPQNQQCGGEVPQQHSAFRIPPVQGPQKYLNTGENVPLGGMQREYRNPEYSLNHPSAGFAPTYNSEYNGFSSHRIEGPSKYLNQEDAGELREGSFHADQHTGMFAPQQNLHLMGDWKQSSKETTLFQNLPQFDEGKKNVPTEPQCPDSTHHDIDSNSQQRYTRQPSQNSYQGPHSWSQPSKDDSSRTVTFNYGSVFTSTFNGYVEN